MLGFAVAEDGYDDDDDADDMLKLCRGVFVFGGVSFKLLRMYINPAGID